METWSPAFIWYLAEYRLAFNALGAKKDVLGNLPRDYKQREKRPKTAENGLVSIDDIIPL